MLSHRLLNGGRLTLLSVAGQGTQQQRHGGLQGVLGLLGAGADALADLLGLHLARQKLQKFHTPEYRAAGAQAQAPVNQTSIEAEVGQLDIQL